VTERVRATPTDFSVAVNQELLRRGIRYVDAEIITVSELPDQEIPLVKAGTLTCLIGTEDSALLSDIADAAKHRRFEDLSRYSDVVFGQYVRGLMFRRRASSGLGEVPVLTEFRYSGRTLAQAMFVTDDVEVASASVLYSGGPLDQGQFRVVDHPKDDADLAQRAIVLVNEPRLTDVEKAIIERVPRESSEVFVSSSQVAWPAAAALFVGEALLEGAAAAVAERAVDYAWDHAGQAWDYVVDVAHEAEEAAVDVAHDVERAAEDIADRVIEAPMVMEADAADGADHAADAQAADEGPIADDYGAQNVFGDDAAADDAAEEAEGEAQSRFESVLTSTDFTNLSATASAGKLLELRSKLLTGRG
jgi:hypothetical protein